LLAKSGTNGDAVVVTGDGVASWVGSVRHLGEPWPTAAAMRASTSSNMRGRTGTKARNRRLDLNPK